MNNTSRAATVLALACLSVDGSVSGAQRVFVSSNGSDANTATSCGFSAPCRGFAAAMTVVDAGGEIIALDAAGYGAVTVTKSVSIVANPGFYAGITSSGTPGVTIDTEGVNVLLRGLNINGTGSATGIYMTQGASLTVENCWVSNFLTGIQTFAPGMHLRVSNSVFSGNVLGLSLGAGKGDVIGSRAFGNTYGFVASPGQQSYVPTLNIRDSTASGNQYGFAVRTIFPGSIAHLSLTRVAASNNDIGLLVEQVGATTALAVVGESTFTENGVGWQVAGTLRSLGNNFLDFNTTDISGPVTTVPAH